MDGVNAMKSCILHVKLSLSLHHHSYRIMVISSGPSYKSTNIKWSFNKLKLNESRVNKKVYFLSQDYKNGITYGKNLS